VVQIALGIATSLILGSCGDGVVGPENDDLKIVAVEGDGQLAEPGSRLPRDLVVQVRSADGEPREGRRVRWEIVMGGGGALSDTDERTNALGRARTTLTLGPDPGRFEVRASLGGGGAEPAHLWARAVLRPELAGTSPDPVSPGEIVTLQGSHFIPEVERVVVLFSGIRGRAVAGTPTTLDVRVPSCLAEGPVDVEVAMGALRSGRVPVAVTGGGPVQELQQGESVLVRDPSAVSCVRLPEDTSARYLAVVHSGSPDGIASFPYELRLRGGDAVAAVGAARPTRARGPLPPPIGEFQSRPGEPRIRALEREAVETRLRLRAAPGDVRSFSVLSPSGGFDTVTAEARRVGDRSVLYVDREAPAGGFQEADLATVGELFDDPIDPTVTGVYGDVSDLDENGRVIVLFTPVVNRHTERGTDGFVGGFFYGVDLLPDRDGSNGGEIFYTLVPDPEGLFGDPRTSEDVLRNVPAILARVLKRGAPRTDALWLSEALATTAEDLVADALVERGDGDLAWDFRVGNYVRARRFLADPATVSLVVTQGEGSLEERGAGWLLLKHLRGRTGGDGILTDLTRTVRTGVKNLATVSGRAWVELVESWAGALYLDGQDVPVEDRFVFRDFDLRGELARVDGGFPFEVPSLGGTDRTVAGTVRASTAAHYLLEPSESGGLAVNLAGPGGGAHPEGSFLAITLVRVR